jgi:tetratricopeptide (TPR) repeat protein
MEFLKYFRLVLCILSFGYSTTFSFGQDITEIVNAFQESYIHEASGEYQEAIEVLRNVYDEKSYEINLRLGWLLYQSGLFTESLAYYNNAISQMPMSIEARYGYAYPASALGNWDQVIKQYEKILEITPNNTIASHRLGLIYYGREEYDKAYRYFEKVVNLYPFDYDGLIMFAWTNYKLNKLREAKVLFQKALMHTPGGVSALEGLDLLK